VLMPVVDRPAFAPIDEPDRRHHRLRIDGAA
jgi:hypothetical protein